VTQPHRLRIPAPAAPPLTGHLPFADTPGVADPIEVTSRWLTRGGRPWFPVSGEFHGGLPGRDTTAVPTSRKQPS
jgi:hypothetical protein